MKKETLIQCGTCTYWYHHPNGRTTVCRRNPPQVTIMMMDQQVSALRQPQLVPVPFAAFPSTGETESCGEWRQSTDHTSPLVVQQ